MIPIQDISQQANICLGGIYIYLQQDKPTNGLNSLVDISQMQSGSMSSKPNPKNLV